MHSRPANSPLAPASVKDVDSALSQALGFVLGFAFALDFIFGLGLAVVLARRLGAAFAFRGSTVSPAASSSSTSASSM